MKQGIVYKLTSNGLIYIGSTENTLKRRINYGHHRAFTKYGFNLNDYTEEILEIVSFTDKNELFKIEGEYMKKYDCVNNRNPVGYGKNKKEYDKYRYLNSDIKQQRNNYYHANKEKVNNRRKEMYRFKKAWGDLLSIDYHIFH